MPCVAFFTFGIMREPKGHPQVQGFFTVDGAVFAAARSSPGFIDGRGFVTDHSTNPPAGRRDLYPAAVTAPECHPPQASTLSLWQSLEAVFGFAYHGIHAEALRQRKEWFVKPAWPVYAAWWVEDGDTPSWEEAMARLDHLHQHGSTPQAFDFKAPFDAAGNPTTMAPTATRTLERSHA
ncbi:MAG: DUF3291 domain-containing protein [Chloroflexota bacterium]